MNVPCKARQYSDQMVCAECNLAWDVNDLEPPPCGAAKDEKQKEADRRSFVAKTKQKMFWR